MSVVKETSELAWQVYGVTLYFSKASDGCSEENAGFMIVMVLFLVLAAIKLLVIIGVIAILIYTCIANKMKKRNERAASRGILRSLGRIKYSTLSSIGQSETDEECSICFCDYTDEDIVTKLECNEKHIFHEQCISSWI